MRLHANSVIAIKPRPGPSQSFCLSRDLADCFIIFYNAISQGASTRGVRRGPGQHCLLYSIILRIMEEPCHMGSHGEAPGQSKGRRQELAFDMQANWSRAIPRGKIPLPNHPKARYQASRSHLYSPKPAEIIQIGQSQTAYTALPSPSHGNLNKGHGLSVPLAPVFCLQTLPASSLCSHVWHTHVF